MSHRNTFHIAWQKVVHEITLFYLLMGKGRGCPGKTYFTVRCGMLFSETHKIDKIIRRPPFDCKSQLTVKMQEF